jgi:DNA-binding CsgD family transcriptional regulator
MEDMSRSSSARLVASVYDAALAPELWPGALETVAEHFAAAGADYSLWNKRNGKVEWLSVSGPMIQYRTDYIKHYYAVDPFQREATLRPTRDWMQATKVLPGTLLRGDEWYNDFLLKSGVEDLLAIRLYETTSHVVFFEFHRGIGGDPLAEAGSPGLKELLEPLTKAARLRIELRKAGLDHRARLGREALDYLSTGVIIVDRDGRAIDLNQAAERVLRRQDGLVLRHGKLRALRENEDVKLRNSLTAAAADEKRVTAVAHLLVNRRAHHSPYTLSVAPLVTTGASHVDPLVVVFVADPEALSPSDGELMEVFGWSPAETRLAVALMAGKSLPDVAAEFDISVTVVGRQFKSILKKAGVRTHGDLLRAVHGIAVKGDALAAQTDPAILPRTSRGDDADLSSREAEILRWMKDGKTNAQIAAIISISAKTVEFHLRNIMRKLGASNRTSAVVIAIRRGLLRA